MKNEVKLVLALLLMQTAIMNPLLAQTADSVKTDKHDTTSFKLGNMRVFIVDDKEEKKDTAVHKQKELRISAELGDEDKSSKDRAKDKKPKKHVPSYWGGLSIGTNGYLTKKFSPDPPSKYGFLDLNQAKSIQVGLNFADVKFNLYRNYVHLVTGMGLEWNNYRFTNNYTLYSDTNVVSAYKSGNTFQKNKLVVNYLRVPLLIGWNTNPMSKKNIHGTVGIIGAWNFGSHTKQVFESGGTRYKNKVSDDYNLAPFKYDLTASVGYRDISLFATYSLTELFRDKRGPELHPFTVGIKFF